MMGACNTLQHPRLLSNGIQRLSKYRSTGRGNINLRGDSGLRDPPWGGDRVSYVRYTRTLFFLGIEL